MDNFEEMPLVNHSTVKRFEDFRAITDEESAAYKLALESEFMPDGTMELNGYKLVAMGQSYGTVGDKFVITLRDYDGTTKELKVMMADVKQNQHTLNGEGYCGFDGHIIEGIVYMDLLDEMPLMMGDLDYIESWRGEVIRIRKVINSETNG